MLKLERILLSKLSPDLNEYNQRTVRRMAKRASITSSGCILCAISVDANGRSRINYRKRPLYAHRLILTFREPPPYPTALALHSCDTPNCINPDHLRWGDQTDNVNDRTERNPHRTWHRLTNADNDYIKQAYAEGTSQAAIARRLNTSQVTISQRLKRMQDKSAAPQRARIAVEIDIAKPNPLRKKLARDPVLLNAWHSMRTRVKKEGLPIDPAWHIFETFAAHIGARPSPRHTLYREDKSAGYVPGNVRWATFEEQNNNRSNSLTVRARLTSKL